MHNTAIEVRNLSKVYSIGVQKPDSLVQSIRQLFKVVQARPFVALDDVDLTIREGEAVGIIGRNGAGKSTLLKVLSRITYPSSGSVTIFGGVSSLLEVGTGFHPELTGRENVFLNGTILGMKRSEIKKRFDEIVEFSGVENFLDTPLKRFSSGMKVRLAFSVAAHLEPEILIIDEVLAVGDLEFQKKCLGKMEDVVAGGRTVIFVSHNMQAVRSLTTRAIVLEKGRIAYDGSVEGGIEHYLGANARTGYTEQFSANEAKEAFVDGVEVLTSHGGNEQLWGAPLSFKFALRFRRQLPGACFAFQIVDRNMNNVGYFWLYRSDFPFGEQSGPVVLTCKIDRCLLFEGEYYLKLWLTDRASNELLDHHDLVAHFRVSLTSVEREEYGWKSGDCVFLQPSKWSTSLGEKVIEVPN